MKANVGDKIVYRTKTETVTALVLAKQVPEPLKKTPGIIFALYPERREVNYMVYDKKMVEVPERFIIKVLSQDEYIDKYIRLLIQLKGDLELALDKKDWATLKTINPLYQRHMAEATDDMKKFILENWEEYYEKLESSS